jgi:hypothetical protein
VTLEQKLGQGDPTALDSAEFSISFDEPINTGTFIVGDITLA